MSEETKCIWVVVLRHSFLKGRKGGWLHFIHIIVFMDNKLIRARGVTMNVSCISLLHKSDIRHESTNDCRCTLCRAVAPHFCCVNKWLCVYCDFHGKVNWKSCVGCFLHHLVFNMFVCNPPCILLSDPVRPDVWPWSCREWRTNCWAATDEFEISAKKTLTI